MTDAKRGWQSTVLVPVFAPAVIVTLLLPAWLALIFDIMIHTAYELH